MEFGREPWKWGLVLMLLAVFLVVANQAYVAVTSQETFDPPDDYLKGDSFDLEHQAGPGAGTPIDVPADLPPDASPPDDHDDDEPGEQPTLPPPGDVDWNDVPDPTKR
jgi:hypothetical protein